MGKNSLGWCCSIALLFLESVLVDRPMETVASANCTEKPRVAEHLPHFVLVAASAVVAAAALVAAAAASAAAAAVASAAAASTNLWDDVTSGLAG